MRSPTGLETAHKERTSIELDHKNRDRTDNRWGNLRAASRQQNLSNKLKRRGKYLAGVSRNGRKWVAMHGRCAQLALLAKTFTHSKKPDAMSSGTVSATENSASTLSLLNRLILPRLMIRVATPPHQLFWGDPLMQFLDGVAQLLGNAEHAPVVSISASSALRSAFRVFITLNNGQHQLLHRHLVPRSSELPDSRAKQPAFTHPWLWSAAAKRTG